ncbi:unnamed protein product [Ostreobium quekettii]|uniref:Hydroxyproline O-arabinosyltransferase-like domain-containing protein n=1 Tax=Ostreobium quekettii TaxID=121088 RepID=A0A8S1J5Y1_9CHLO|nr:unnamed protein product [Ostreobium quekettii]
MYPLERGPLANIPATGPAPVLVRPAELHKVVLDWERLALHIEGDNESKEKLGWVREMYAFSIACALNDVHLDLRPVPSNPLIVQPPADSTLGEAAMYHYTWGSAFLDGAGNKVYEFDKRQYTAADLQFKVPILATPPPFQEGWKLHDSSPVSQEKYGLVKDMIDRMNEGIRALPVLPIDAQSKLQ